MIGLPADQHLFLADTNPPEEGQDSWLWDVWFRLLEAEENEVDVRELPLKRQLARVDFDLSDNIFDPPDRIEELKARYAHDPDIYARYIEGRWIQSSEDALFYKVFRQGVHVVGEIETKLNSDPEIMVPEPNCFELITGWDLGVTNSAAVIAEKTYRDEPITDSEGKQTTHRVPVIKFLDELVITDEVFDMRDFVKEVCKRMDFWQDITGRGDKILWRAWSDRSAWDMRDPVHNRYHHQIVYEASEGRIVLTAAERGPGSVAQRVDLWKKLLFDERLFFSASKCPKLIEMNKSMKRGKSSIAVIQKGSKHKHPFDAASYLVASECLEDLQRQNTLSMFSKRKQESSLVSVSV